jgi:lipid-A-disaccharide synthase
LSARLLLSCGEPSGDLYAGALTRELRALDPGVRVAGLGGPLFAAGGGVLLEDYRGLAVTGLTEAIAKVPRSYATIRRLAAAAGAERPDALVVIDFPDFNFPLARRVKRLGIPVVYYISPQIWAWRARRLKTIREIADRVLVIFPFEEQIYRDGGVPVEFVGHPLVDLATPSATREVFLRAHHLAPDAPTVAILPGSRPNEVSRILPDLAAAADLIRVRVPGSQFMVARAPDLDDRLFDAARGRQRAPITIIEGDTDAILASADVALTASGTATVQTALHDTPMVIVYRLSPVTYRIGRRLVTVDTVGMVNLIAGEKIVPELIQEQFTPETVAHEAVSMLTDPARVSRIRAGLARVRALLGGSGASRRAAQAILRVIQDQKAMSKLAAVCLCLLASAAAVHATVLVPADLGELSRDARAIARGRVVKVEPRWTDDHRTIETIVSLEVDTYLKGSLGSVVQFRVPGGALGRYRSILVGAPEFVPEERVVVFLGAVGPSVLHVLGLSQGVFRVVPAARGGDWAVAQPLMMPVVTPTRLVRGSPSQRPVPLAEFERRVRALAGGAR